MPRPRSPAIDKLHGPGLVRDLQGSACRPDPRRRRQAEGSRQASRAAPTSSTPSALRVVEAYGSWLSRNGAKDEALEDLQGLRQGAAAPSADLDGDGQAQGGREAAAARRQSPQAGAAEALYGLGASLGRRGGEDLGLVYLQLALYLAPNHPLALLSLADLYESLKKPELAIKVYERIPPTSPLHRNAAIQMATDLDALDRTDEAKKHLAALITGISRTISKRSWRSATSCAAHKQFAECADIYSKAHRR